MILGAGGVRSFASTKLRSCRGAEADLRQRSPLGVRGSVVDPLRSYRALRVTAVQRLRALE